MGVENAREVLPRLASPYHRAYYGGVICQRQAKLLLAQRGRRTSSVAWEWLRYAMDDFEEATRLEPERLEPVLRFNTCVRLLERYRHFAPSSDENGEHEIE